MRSETKVGILVLATILAVVGFAYALGIFGFLQNTHQLNVQYNFAGGIEVGSPVRVMGIKVGKVNAIKFQPDMKTATGEEAKLLIQISVSKEAWESIREDSRFYINLAGVIGEKFLEITPGSSDAPLFKPNAFVRGEDPPRIDQLISQGYGLAGKLLDIVERNEGTVVGTLEKLENFLKQMNQTLALLDRVSKNKQIPKFMDDVTHLTSDLKLIAADLRPLTKGLNSEKANETYELLHKLIFRLEGLDKEAIRKFFQEEGIRAKLL